MANKELPSEALLLPSFEPSINNATVLIVEDNPSMALMIRKSLEQDNYRILVAENGAEALATYQPF